MSSSSGESWLKSQGPKPALFIRKGSELPLSGPALIVLLRAVLDKNKPFRFRAKGFSMTPFLKDGDGITISPLSDASPRLGDVMACIHPADGTLLVHRVVKQNGAAWLIQGDNAAETDGLLTKADMLGRVTRIERGGKRIFFGLGIERYPIVWLIRLGCLSHAKSAFSLLRRMAGAVLCRLQSLGLYRTVFRGMRPRFFVAEATVKDMAAVHSHFNPGMPTPPPADNDQNATDYVAKRGTKVVGFVQMAHYPETNSPWCGYWLFSLAVWPLYRRFGIGEALTRRVIEQAGVQDAPDLFAAVYEDNGRAINLYRKLGFEHITLPALEPHLEAEKRQCGRQRIVMRRKISEAAFV